MFRVNLHMSSNLPIFLPRFRCEASAPYGIDLNAKNVEYAHSLRGQSRPPFSLCSVSTKHSAVGFAAVRATGTP